MTKTKEDGGADQSAEWAGLAGAELRADPLGPAEEVKKAAASRNGHGTTEDQQMLNNQPAPHAMTPEQSAASVAKEKAREAGAKAELAAAVAAQALAALQGAQKYADKTAMDASTAKVAADQARAEAERLGDDAEIEDPVQAMVPHNYTLRLSATHVKNFKTGVQTMSRKHADDDYSRRHGVVIIPEVPRAAA